MPTDQHTLKTLCAQAAIAYVKPQSIIGVGSGSTVALFIHALGLMPQKIAGAVSSSEHTSGLLRDQGLVVLEANQVESLAVYVDGADEIDAAGHMIKGGGAALTREKIVADLSQRFICIADASKQVVQLGSFGLPLEIIPMAAAQITRRFKSLGGQAVIREGVMTDNGGAILDVQGLQIGNPLALELEINQWPGVISVGLFARRKADVCLLGTAQGVQTLFFTQD
jgi:ribose 5-phosphate isomerase A